MAILKPYSTIWPDLETNKLTIRPLHLPHIKPLNNTLRQQQQEQNRGEKNEKNKKRNTTNTKRIVKDWIRWKQSLNSVVSTAMLCSVSLTKKVCFMMLYNANVLISYTPVLPDLSWVISLNVNSLNTSKNRRLVGGSSFSFWADISSLLKLYKIPSLKK